MTIVSIVNTKFDVEGTNFESRFTTWEVEITNFENAVGKTIMDETKVGLLIAGTKGPLHDHECMQITTVNADTTID